MLRLHFALPAFRNLTFGLVASIAAFSPVLAHATNATSTGMTCEAVFQGIFTKIPRPSEVAKPHADEVQGLAGQATVVHKVSEVLPAGRYLVVVRGQNESGSAEDAPTDVLTVSYTLFGAEMSLNGVTLLKMTQSPLRVSTQAGTQGDVSGSLAKIRLYLGKVTLVSSVFSGNPDSQLGVERRDTSVDLELTRGKPVVLTLRETIKTGAERADENSPPLVIQKTVEIRGRITDPR